MKLKTAAYPQGSQTCALKLRYNLIIQLLYDALTTIQSIEAHFVMLIAYHLYVRFVGSCSLHPAQKTNSNKKYMYIQSFIYTNI